MQTATGSCVLTSVTLEQVEDLEQVLSVLTDQGWVVPPGLVLLREAVNSQYPNKE